MFPASLVRHLCCKAALVASFSGFLAGRMPAAENVAAADASKIAERILAQSGVQGGLIVLVGLGDPPDGALAAALGGSGRFLVQGLDSDDAKVARARQHIQSLGRYGPIAVDRWSGERLPYIDQLANLVLIADGVSMDREEVLRVLLPDGVAMTVSTDGELRITDRWVKPRPKELDDWTHYLYDASGNAVSQDRTVGFPSQFQWIGGPRYSRHHDHMSSASAMVSASGRLFYIFDHASPLSIQLPSQWQLVARDAFNGAVLWRRDMGPWFSQMQRLKSGPANLPRRLVAVGDTVYVTLALDAPLTALDAATGETRRVFEGTQGTDEILLCDGRLVLVVNREGHSRDPAAAFSVQQRVVMAVDPHTGRKLWEKEWPWAVPGSLSVKSGRVVFFDGERLVALDQQTGDVLWQSEALGRRGPVPVYFSPCLVLYGDLVLFSGAALDNETYHADNGPTMYGLSAADGKTLWKAPHPPSGYRSAEDILVAGGLVWTGDLFNSRETRTEQTGTIWGRDPRTGEVKAEFAPDVDTHWFHHRCYRAKATENYLLTSRTGIEFVDFREQKWTCHHWVRGACLYGVMPANGMVYTPPHPCACYLEAKLYGFNALASKSAARQELIAAAERGERLERGPAYDLPIEAKQAAATDWPTFRSDAARSGSVAADLPAELSPAWKATIGGRLSSPVAAEGRLFVASIDRHQVHALNAASGEPLWQFTAGARVDSPPTVWRGRVLFGSADGYVYCLRADDGRMIWRYLAAPANLRMGAFEQIESVWPVHGSVLVRESGDGQAELWCVAGRSMFLDGGMRLVRLNPATGTLVGQQVLDDRLPGTEANLQAAISTLNMPVALPDVLVGHDKYIYMRSQTFDLEGNRVEIEAPNRRAEEQRGEMAHLFSPTGLLDDAWWHRSYWVFGRVWKSGAGGYYQTGRQAPSGRPMVFDDQMIYSFGRKPEYYRWTTPMEYMLYGTARQPQVVPLEAAKKVAKPKAKKTGAGLGDMPPTTIQTSWREDVPLFVRAMVLAGDTLFVAGPLDLIDEPKTLTAFALPATQELLARQAAVFEGSEGAMLWAVSAADGKKLAEQPLGALPVFDGLIAAGGRLYYTATDGTLTALGPR